jgi:hypothetical protein
VKDNSVDKATDELLNRIWYAGAYTNQLCTIDPHHGNALVHLGTINSSVSDATNVTWYYNYTITEGSSALVDGAKRDKLVWAGGELTFTGGFGCVANSGGRYGYCGAGDCGLDKRCHLD